MTAQITIELTEATRTFLRIACAVRNNSVDTSFKLASTMTSFVVRIFFGEVPWRFVGISSDITRWARLEPQGAHNWEGIVPISSRFSNLGPEHPGFVELGAGEYTLQLICAIDWDLPVRTPFSPDQRAAVIADKFDWELASNVIHFQIA